VIPPTDELDQKMLTYKFKEVSNCRYCIGLYTCAAYNNKGIEISQPNFPFMVQLVPTVIAERGIVTENKH